MSSMALSLHTATAVIELNVTTFSSYVNESDNHWIFEFYAPWCSHCRKLLPILERLESYAENIVKIGKIDATKYTELAKVYKVTRYPTIMYKVDGVIGQYDGPRTFAGLSSFVDRLEAPLWLTIGNINQLRHESTRFYQNISFVFGISCAKVAGCNSGKEAIIYNNYDHIARKMRLHTTFILHLASKPSVCKYELVLDKYDTYHPVEQYCFSDDLNNLTSIEGFVVNNNYPLLNEFESHNFKNLAQLNKTMVIAVVDSRVKERSQEIVEALKVSARYALEVNPQKYIFGYLDGYKWKGFIKYHQSAPPSLLIIDHEADTHASFKILRTDNFEKRIKTILQDVMDGAVLMQKSVQPPYWSKILHRLETYQPLSLLLFCLPMILIAISYLFPHPSDKKKSKEKVN